MKINLFFLAAIIMFSINSCSDDEDLHADELLLLKSYMETNFSDSQPDANNLYFIKQKTGIGELVVQGATIKVHYKGSYISSATTLVQFDSTFGKEPFEFTVGNGDVIEGWELGIVKMRKGSTAIIVMPSDLAYGGVKNGLIPEYSSLLFEIEVVEVNIP